MSQATTAFDLVPASRSSVPASSTSAPWLAGRRGGARRRVAIVSTVVGAFGAIGLAAVLAGGEPASTAPATAARETIPLRVEVATEAPADVPAIVPQVEVASIAPTASVAPEERPRATATSASARPPRRPPSPSTSTARATATTAPAVSAPAPPARPRPPARPHEDDLGI
jgi:hypothetical protein